VVLLEQMGPVVLQVFLEILMLQLLLLLKI
jgi:hypothetical protein